MPSVWMIGFAGMLGSPDAAQIHDELARLASGLRVLYVAAHPDDEHTELLAWLASGRHAQVAYLSLTRGEGGQNRIGAKDFRAWLLGRAAQLRQLHAERGGRLWARIRTTDPSRVSSSRSATSPSIPNR